MEPELKGDKWSVKVPAYRADILHPIDLLEEVSIGIGYDEFPEFLPKETLFGKSLKSRKRDQVMLSLEVWGGPKEPKRAQNYQN